MRTRLRVPVERRTLAEQIYTSLKRAIVKGDLRPGERPKEIELAQTLGASRTPVREALSCWSGSTSSHRSRSWD